MQTVTPISSSGAPASAGASEDTGDTAAFHATLRGAMAPSGGKDLPPTDGEALPDGVQPAQAAQATAASPVAAAAGKPSEGDSDEVPADIGSDLPTITSALHDIAASRQAARAGRPALAPVASAAQTVVTDAPAEPATATTPLGPAGLLTDASPAADADQDTPAEPRAAEAVTTPSAVPLAAPTSPPVAPSGTGTPIAAAATAHAREVVLDRPAANRASGLLGKGPSAEAPPADVDAPAAGPALPPNTPSVPPGDGNPAATATRHAHQAALERPTGGRATGLSGRAAASDGATVKVDAAAADPALPPNTPSAPPGNGNPLASTTRHVHPALASASADSGPVPVAAQTLSPADSTAAGAAALAATVGPAPPSPAVTVGSGAGPVSAPPDLHIAAGPGSPQFGPELGERVLWLVRDGLHEARLQLNPRDLGPVEVRLSFGDGAAQVSFSTQHAGTAAAVQQSLPQLRELLAQQGLQLGQATVSHQPAGDGQAAQQQAQGSGGQPGWGRSRGGDVEDSLPVPTARVVGHGLVDAYA